MTVGQAGADAPQTAFDAEKYWAERYSTIDITKSGHVDLPARYNHWLYETKKRALFRDLAAAGFRPQGASVLEIATGTGVYVEAWQERGVAKLVGIDISAAATAEMQRRFPRYSFLKRDLAEPGLTEVTGGGFDLVTAVDMLYHVIDDGKFPAALANLAAAAKPGGLLAIHDLFLHVPEKDYGYIKLRTLEAYEKALDAAGFDIVSRRASFFFSVQPSDVVSPRALRLWEAVWSRVTEPLIRRSPDFAGRFTSSVDGILAAFRSEGPSFEMMICRRRTPRP